MPSRRLRVLCRAAGRYGGILALVSSLLVPAATAQSTRALPAGARAVLERFAGTWDVTLTVKKPQAAVVTYALTNAWVLDDHFLRGDTGIKSDGSHELSMFGYDPATRTYPLWIFYTSGLVAYLARGEWDEKSRTMSWRSIIDRTTDIDYLHSAIEAAWTSVGTASPNRDSTPEAVELHALDASPAAMRHLLRQLCSAA